MKKGILVVILIIILSSFVSAGILEALTGRQISEINEKYTLTIGDEINIVGKTLRLENVGAKPDEFGKVGNIQIVIDNNIDEINLISPSETKIIHGLKITNIQSNPPTIRSNIWHMEVGTDYSIPQGNKPFDVMIEEISSNRDVKIKVNGISDTIPLYDTHTVNNLPITNDVLYTTLIIGKDFIVNDPIDGMRVVRTARQNLKIGTQYAIQNYDSNGNIKYYDITLEEVLNDRSVKVKVNDVVDTIPLGDTHTVKDIEISNDGKYYTLLIGREIVDRSSGSATISISYETPASTGVTEISPNEEPIVEETIPETPKLVISEKPKSPTLRSEVKCMNGCVIGGDTCIPFGTRVEGRYCDISKQFLNQIELELPCDNNYECLSNDCKDGKCVSTYSLLEKILNFLKNLFK